MYRFTASVGLCAALAACALGCGEVRYGAPDFQDRILSTTQRRVPGESVRAQAWQQGTELRVHALRHCDLVQWHEIERTTEWESDEDHEVEWIILGVSSVPLTTGIILLADSPAVYEEDRNARQYNPNGPEGAIAGGVILLAAGTILAVVPTVELIRTSGRQQEQSIVHERGRVLRPDVTCDADQPAQGALVAARISTLAGEREQERITLGTTNSQGKLVVDLAQAIPPAAIEGPIAPHSLELWVADRMVGLIDLLPVRRAHRQLAEQRDEAAWQQADAASCRERADEQACAAVRAYLERFPTGAHADEAKSLLGLVSPGPAADSPLVKQTDDGKGRPTGPAGQAAERAREAAKRQCRETCRVSCRGDRACEALCRKEACP